MNCPICRSIRTKLFHNRVWSMENASVYQCEECRLTFLFPVMTEEEEKIFYQNYNAHAERRGVVTHPNPEELHQKSKPVAIERFDQIKHFFENISSVLEIGPSTGAFLELLSNKKRFAVELTKDNRRFCSRFCEKTFEDISNVDGSMKFDLICMFHVFEHIRNPFDFLGKLKKHMNQNSRIIVEVPNIEDPLISLYNCQAYKDFYFQPMHPFVYNLDSLSFVFKNCGFRKEEAIFYQRYGLDNHLAWLAKGRPGGDPLYHRLFANDEIYKNVLKKNEKTDTLFFIATI
ncbi:MAG: class I SAM-dependent methyltransferase [Candidatus Rifleibacteriota bacterium]